MAVGESLERVVHRRQLVTKVQFQFGLQAASEVIVAGDAVTEVRDHCRVFVGQHLPEFGFGCFLEIDILVADNLTNEPVDSRILALEGNAGGVDITGDDIPVHREPIQADAVDILGSVFEAFAECFVELGGDRAQCLGEALLATEFSSALAGRIGGGDGFIGQNTGDHAAHQ